MLLARGSQLAVAWYTEDKQKNAVVKFAWSKDQGKTFSPPLILDDKENLGRVAGTLLADGRAIVAWFDIQSPGKASLVVTLISTEGVAEKPTIVAEVAASRRSGFPTMTSNGKVAFVSWTDVEKKRIRTARIELTP